MLTIVQNKDCLVHTFIYKQSVKQSLSLITFCTKFLDENKYLSFFNMN